MISSPRNQVPVRREAAVPPPRTAGSARRGFEASGVSVKTPPAGPPRARILLLHFTGPPVVGGVESVLAEPSAAMCRSGCWSRDRSDRTILTTANTWRSCASCAARSTWRRKWSSAPSYARQAAAPEADRRRDGRPLSAGRRAPAPKPRRRIRAPASRGGHRSPPRVHHRSSLAAGGRGRCIETSPIGDAPEAVALRLIRTLTQDRGYRLRRRVLSAYTWEVIMRDRIVLSPPSGSTASDRST